MLKLAEIYMGLRNGSMWLVPFVFCCLYICSFQVLLIFLLSYFFHENVESCICWYAVLEFEKEVCFTSADLYTIALEMGYILS